MKVFTKEKFIEILKMDGWEHEEYLLDKVKCGISEGLVGTTSRLKYKDTTLVLTIAASWFQGSVSTSIPQYKKNFVVYDGEDEIIDYYLEDILSIQNPNGFDAFVECDEAFIEELTEINIKIYKEDQERRLRNQRLYALQIKEKGLKRVVF